jgi:D-3-phosphoglycerate dehydrogenase
MTVLIADAVDPVCAARLRAAGLDVREEPGLDEDALVAAVRDVAALIVRGRARVTRRVLDAAPALRVVVRAGSGVDTIDVEAARKLGVEVRNVPGGNAVSVAELAIGFFLALARHIPEAAELTRAGLAKRGSPLGRELAGRTLGLVGFGRIGREVARRAQAFDIAVLAADPLLTPETAHAANVECVLLTDLLLRASLVSLHVPLLPETRGLLGEDELALLRPGTLFVNTARAEVVDHEVLLAAIEDGRLAGAGLDVLDAASPAADALRRHPRVIVTPHLGAATREAQTRVAAAAAELVLDALAQKAPKD